MNRVHQILSNHLPPFSSTNAVRWSLFLIGLAAILGLGIWFNRDPLFAPYDQKYAQNRYDFSQWTIAQSLRPIDDATLYQVAGYRLTSEWEYYTINPEVPPLGKYFYGWSIQLFGNPYLATIPLYLSAVTLFFLLAQLFFRKPSNSSANKTKPTDPTLLAMIATTLFAALPLLLGHLGDTLLDLPQLIGVFLFLLGIMYMGETPSVKTDRSKLSRPLLLGTVLAAIGLGWFVSVKIGFFAVALVGSAVIYLFRTRQLLWLIPVGIGAGVFYLLVYLPFFFTGGSIAEFLSSQKWMLAFYLEGNEATRQVYGTILPMLFAGMTIGWWEDASWSRVAEWTIFWPVLAASPLIAQAIPGIRHSLENNKRWFLLAYFLLMIASLAYVPLFTRYVILILPIGILFLTAILQKLPRWVWIGTIVLMILHIPFRLQPSFESTVSAIEYHLSSNTYQDLYAHLDPATKQEHPDRQEFWRERLTDLSQIPIRQQTTSVTIVDAPESIFDETGTIQIETIYETPMGNIRVFTPTAPVKRQPGGWKLEWDDSIILPEYDASATVQSSVVPGEYGRLLLPDGTVVSEAVDWAYYQVIPGQIEDEVAVRTQLMNLTGIPDMEVERLYKSNSITSIPQDIGFRLESAELVSEDELEPGIVQTTRKQRVAKVEGLTDQEQAAVEQFAQRSPGSLGSLDPIIGGTVVLQYPDGREIVIHEQEPQDGIDTVLDEE